MIPVTEGLLTECLLYSVLQFLIIQSGFGLMSLSPSNSFYFGFVDLLLLQCLPVVASMSTCCAQIEEQLLAPGPCPGRPDEPRCRMTFLRHCYGRKEKPESNPRFPGKEKADYSR